MRFLFLWTSVFLIVASSCKKSQQSDFPNVNVEEYIYLNNPASYDLTSPGGWLYNPGGLKGLVIIRRFVNGTQDDFAVFDRACPEHFDDNCSQLVVSDDDTFLECSCSKEKYLLFDGSPGTGASLGMKQYGTNFDGSVLRIFN